MIHYKKKSIIHRTFISCVCHGINLTFCTHPQKNAFVKTRYKFKIPKPTNKEKGQQCRYKQHKLHKTPMHNRQRLRQAYKDFRHLAN